MSETPSGNGRVAGKVAIITGAASGIGRGCAEALAREGARVILTDVNEADGRAATDALGAPHAFRTLDVTDEAGWLRVVDETLADAGRLDILINAAGIGVLADIENTTLAQFRRTYEVNVEGVFLGCRTAIGAMKRTGGGSIINLSSVAGLVADPNLAAYCASKGAVRLLTKSVALHCARKHYGIRCNSVHPSFIDTPMVAGMAHAMGGGARDILAKAAPLGRLGTVAEVAALVLYLASDESAFTTGAELVIDGGLTAR
jgi:3(or 17)beta-hydroxysteroid dehydrogenase